MLELYAYCRMGQQNGKVVAKLRFLIERGLISNTFFAAEPGKSCTEYCTKFSNGGCLINGKLRTPSYSTGQHELNLSYPVCYYDSARVGTPCKIGSKVGSCTDNGFCIYQADIPFS